MNIKLEKYTYSIVFLIALLLSGCHAYDNNYGEAVRYRNSPITPVVMPYNNPYYYPPMAFPSIPSYGNQQAPYSRHYSNPYDIAPENNYYDSDQYYVAPSNYSVDVDVPDAGFERF